MKLISGAGYSELHPSLLRRSLAMTAGEVSLFRRRLEVTAAWCGFGVRASDHLGVVSKQSCHECDWVTCFILIKITMITIRNGLLLIIL